MSVSPAGRIDGARVTVRREALPVLVRGDAQAPRPQASSRRLPASDEHHARCLERFAEAEDGGRMRAILLDVTA
jgi:hypothetical protein